MPAGDFNCMGCAIADVLSTTRCIWTHSGLQANVTTISSYFVFPLSESVFLFLICFVTCLEFHLIILFVGIRTPLFGTQAPLLHEQTPHAAHDPEPEKVL